MRSFENSILRHFLNTYYLEILGKKIYYGIHIEYNIETGTYIRKAQVYLQRYIILVIYM